MKYFQKISGLGIARDLLEPIKKKHPNVTYADLYILAGVVAVEEMGGNFLFYFNFLFFLQKCTYCLNIFHQVLKLHSDGEEVMQQNPRIQRMIQDFHLMEGKI